METDTNRSRTRGRGDVDDDQDGVLENLKCVVCLEVPQGRIEQCTNGHLWCSEAGDGDGTSCASRVRAVSGPKCPVCRHGLPSRPIRALAAEQTIAALPASCHPCSSTMLRGSEEKHNKLQRDMLLSAATLGDPRMVSLLLDRTGVPSDFEYPNHGGETMLFAASGNGHVAVASFLLERGAKT